jgi:hypothetical protein
MTRLRRKKGGGTCMPHVRLWKKVCAKVRVKMISPIVGRTRFLLDPLDRCVDRPWRSSEVSKYMEWQCSKWMSWAISVSLASFVSVRVAALGHPLSFTSIQPYTQKCNYVERSALASADTQRYSGSVSTFKETALRAIPPLPHFAIRILRKADGRLFDIWSVSVIEGHRATA